jgi:hypothetical protein
MYKDFLYVVLDLAGVDKHKDHDFGNLSSVNN